MTPADRIAQLDVVHYATEYTTGDQDVPTACGKTISTWAKAPDERATSHDKDTTCPVCLRHVATQLRADLDEACADPGGWRLKAVRRGLQLRAERAAHERTRSDLDAARAEAAAKHNALVHAYEVLRSPTVAPSGHSGDEGSVNCDEDCAKCAVEAALSHADEALAIDAGRALLERHDAELRQLREARDAAVKAREDAEAQLAKVRHDRDEMIRVHDEVEADRDQLRAENARLSQREPTNDEMERALAGREEAFLGGTIRRCRVCRCAVFGGPTACIRCVEREDRDKYKALLSRAVAALQDMADLQWNSRHPNCDQRKVDNARAILADPAATAAVDAYRAREEELIASVGALYRGEWATNEERDVLIDRAWDAVDARRGGGR